jgi:hypothetical protein
VWLRYARWLVAGLTCQLAADLVETSITTDWAAIARVGAIAVIRTFLNYFLERDLAEVRERQKEGQTAGTANCPRPWVTAKQACYSSHSIGRIESSMIHSSRSGPAPGAES